MSATVGLINKFWGRDRGGVEAVLHAQACDLAQRGFGVKVLACRPPGSRPRAFPPGVAGRELHAPVVAFSMPLHWGFGRALEEMNERCDVLHFHLPFPLAAWSALGLRKRSPWVATVHAEVLGKPDWMLRADQALTAAFLQRVDAILVSSESAARFPTLAPFRDKVRVMPFGFDLAPFLALPEPSERRVPEPTIIFLGRLVAYKGLDTLLRAALGLPSKVVIIGEGRERPQLERLARALGVSGRVRFLGHLPDAAVPARLSQADVFVLPSRTQAETFGVAQVEAMAAGLPVVNTALATGTDWVSTHGHTGLTVRPNDPVALAGALGHLLADRGFRHACGRRARQRAQSLFSLERRGPELAALYHALLPARMAS